MGSFIFLYQKILFNRLFLLQPPSYHFHCIIFKEDFGHSSSSSIEAMLNNSDGQNATRIEHSLKILNDENFSKINSSEFIAISKSVCEIKYGNSNWSIRTVHFDHVIAICTNAHGYGLHCGICVPIYILHTNHTARWSQTWQLFIVRTAERTLKAFKPNHADIRNSFVRICQMMHHYFAVCRSQHYRHHHHHHHHRHSHHPHCQSRRSFILLHWIIRSLRLNIFFLCRFDWWWYNEPHWNCISNACINFFISL